MSFKRFFAFGCSFTNWSWPTWADIISLDLDLPCDNWGMGGLGNVGIASRMIESDINNQFNDDDLIIILWSTWTREDRYYSDERGYSWNAKGDVTFTFDKHFLETYWSISNDLIKNSNAIISSNKIFGERIKFNGHLFSPLIDQAETSKLEFTDLDKRIAKFYQPHIINDGEFADERVGYDNYPVDGHPSVLAHLHYVQNVIYPKLNLVLKDSTVSTLTTIHHEIKEYVSKLPSGTNWRPGVTELLLKYNFDNGASSRKRHGF